MESQNGYPVLDTIEDCKAYKIGTTTVYLSPRAAGWLLAYFLRRFNNAVEPLENHHTWGYNKRPIAGTDEWSNHASATAADVNSGDHGYGLVNTFTEEQVVKLRRLQEDFDGCIKWGGDYRNVKDEMHLEIDRDEATVHLMTSVHKRFGKVYLDRLLPGKRNLDTYMVKRKLVKKGYDVGTYNNYYSVALTNALKKFQADNNMNVSGAADTNTLERLGLKPQ